MSPQKPQHYVAYRLFQNMKHCGWDNCGSETDKSRKCHISMDLERHGLLKLDAYAAGV
jgi:hypothetical protein